MKSVKTFRRMCLNIGLLLTTVCFLQTACFSERDSGNQTGKRVSETPGKESNTETKPLPNPTTAVIPASPDTLTVALTRQRKNKEEKVDTETVFLKNDGVRLSVSTVENGFLYIVYQGSDGEAQLIFPNKEYNSGKNEVAANQVVTIPNKGWLFFDEKAGVETIYVIYSQSKENTIGKNEDGGEITLKNKPREIIEFLSNVRGDDSRDAFTTSNGNLVRVVSLKHE